MWIHQKHYLTITSLGLVQAFSIFDHIYEAVNDRAHVLVRYTGHVNQYVNIVVY